MTENALPEAVTQAFLQFWDSYRTDRCFLRKIRTSDPPKFLFHYTNADGLKGIVKKKSLWFTDARYLNDSTEITHGVTVLEAALNQMKDGNNSPFPFSLVPEKVGRLTHAFVACFCEAGDLLTQWRGYSNAGGGYSLGFDSARLFEIVEGRQLVWGPVQYGEEEAVHELRDELQAAQRALEETLSDFVLDGTGRSEFLYYAEMRLLGVLTLLIPFMKHDAFSGEKEWRIVEHRSPSRPPEEDVEFRIAGNTLVPYIPISLEHPNHPAIPLSSVRLGPRIPPFAKESVEAFLERAGIGRIEGKRVKVDGSSVPFRSLV